MNKWEIFKVGFGPSITETNQQLEISYPEFPSDYFPLFVFGTGYNSSCKLKGDFDIQVDYQLFTWPITNGIRVAIVTGVGSTERTSFGPSEFLGYPREIYVTHFADSVQGITGTTDLQGKLRQTRICNEVRKYYFKDGNWILIHNGPASIQDVYFNIGSWSHSYSFSAGNEAKIAFDNFIINSEELVCDSIKLISIDIKPGSDPNCFNQNEHGIIPVAILGNADFQVDNVNIDSLLLQGLAVKLTGKSNKYMAHYEDINSDGYEDLVTQFEDSDGWMDSGTGYARLTGELYNGTPIEGTDSICIVP